MKKVQILLCTGILCLTCLFGGCKKAIPKPDFETQSYKNDVCSFEIPEGWEEYEGLSGDRQIMLVPEDSDFTQSVSNIHVNLSQSSEKHTSLEEMEETFSKEFEPSVLEVNPTAKNFSYSSYEAPNYDVFVAEYDITSDSGKTAHIAQFYPLMKEDILVITTLDAGEGVNVDITAAAKHIINTFEFE